MLCGNHKIKEFSKEIQELLLSDKEIERKYYADKEIECSRYGSCRKTEDTCRSDIIAQNELAYEFCKVRLIVNKSGDTVLKIII